MRARGNSPPRTVNMCGYALASASASRPPPNPEEIIGRAMEEARNGGALDRAVNLCRESLRKLDPAIELSEVQVGKLVDAVRKARSTGTSLGIPGLVKRTVHELELGTESGESTAS